MRILLTNDDGINAPGLACMEKIARAFGGPEAEIWVVAPAFEQSGVGHCISYSRPMMVSKFDERRFAVDGSPADCVLAALYDVMPERPDLVLSGVNRGNNAADNVLYSGTIGATIEAALQGVRAIALSQFFGPENVDLKDPFEASEATAPALIQLLLDKGVWDDGDYRLFYNLNFPPVPAAAVKGHQVVRQGFRSETYFGAEPTIAPNGRRFLWIKGGPQHHPTGPGTDVTANLDGYISITPMRCDLTADDVLTDIQTRLA